MSTIKFIHFFGVRPYNVKTGGLSPPVSFHFHKAADAIAPPLLFDNDLLINSFFQLTYVRNDSHHAVAFRQSFQRFHRLV